MPAVPSDEPVLLEEWEQLDELRPRWAAVAAVTTLVGFSDSCWADEGGWHRQDGAGNAIHLTPLPRGRAVTYGHDHELSETTSPPGEVDVLHGAPRWVRHLLDPLPPDLGFETPGFVYWFDDEVWHRVPYPGDPDDPVQDGASAVGRFMFDDDQAALELLDWATPWIWDAAGAEWDGDEPELVAAAHTLIDDLRDPGQERQALDAFLSVLAPDGVVADVDSASESAAEFTA